MSKLKIWLEQLDKECLVLKNYIVEKYKKAVSIKLPNIALVLLMGIISYEIIRFVIENEKLISKIKDIPGIATIVGLIISSPVAFIIWHFRDVIARQQIENQRKDINLKEFQKIAEWVSGAHLVEDKFVDKGLLKQPVESNNIELENITERSKEFFQPSKETAMQTFSKRDGAIGLQIAAVYNLLPFYRGEHGESFKKPAFNLLITAWLAMQRKYLIKLQSDNNKKLL